MFLRVARALCWLVALGCQPEVGEGVFACATGTCPDGWYCHSRDERCYSTPDDSAAAAAASCSPDEQDACPRPGRCTHQVDLDPALGVCAASCDATADCPSGARCVEVFPDTRRCLASCDRDRDGDCSSRLICSEFGSAASCIPPGWGSHTPPLPEPPAM